MHLADFPQSVDTLVDPELIERWTSLLDLRNAVNGELEKLRQDKIVGTSLEAAVALTADGELARLLETYREVLPMLFMTSAVTLTTDTPVRDGDGSEGTLYRAAGGAARIEVSRVNAAKCPRCWRWVRPAVAAIDQTEDADDTRVCDRCATTLSEAVTTVG